MTTTPTTSIDVEAMGLYVDAIDSKPQNFDWSSATHEDLGDHDDDSITWNSFEYRQPEVDDEAECADCAEPIVFDGEWHHRSGTCGGCDEAIVWGHVDYSDTPGYVHEANDEAKCDPEAEDSDDAWIEETHDAEPDSEYTEDPDYCSGPMMNYWYPVEIRDIHPAAKAIAHLPLCVVTVDGETGLALTGGGMDLSWQICQAFIAIGSYPPFHFVSQLPKMADRWTDEHELVLAVGRKVIEIQRGWVESAAERLEGTAEWMKNRQWEVDNARRAAARGDQS